VRAATAEAIEARQTISIELLYSDQIGRQLTITRFGLVPAGDSWLASVLRHWYLEWDGPRPETDVLDAVDTVNRERDAAEQRAAERSVNPAAAETDGALPRGGSVEAEPRSA